MTACRSEYKSNAYYITGMILYINTFIGNAQLVQPENHACACPGSVLTFSCTTVGLGTTIWTGTAFDCSNTGNQITLHNIQFASGTFGTCNDGRISARGIKVESDGDRHTSQLNVTVLSALNETSIECQYNDADQGIVRIGMAVLTVLQSKTEDMIPYMVLYSQML